MRFCPFCAKENSDEAGHCAHCGKKLPQRRRTATPAPPTEPKEPTVPTAPTSPRLRIPEVVDDGATIPMPMFDPADLEEPGPGARGPGPGGERGDLTDPGPSTSVVVEGAHGTPMEPTPLPAPLPPPPVPVALGERASSGMAVSASQLVSEEVAQPIDLATLPPMPASPASPGVVGAVRYLFPVARAWLARRSAQRRVERALVGDQQALDTALGELGRAAREEDLDLAALREEMGLVKQAEERRDRAESDATAATDRRRAEQEKFARLEEACVGAVAEQEHAVRAVDEELRGEADKRRAEQAVLARIDAELKAREKQAPADPTHGEQIAALTADRDAAAARLTAFDGPIDALGKRLADARAELANRKRALAATVADRQAMMESIDARVKHLGSQREQAQVEIGRRHVTLGTLLNLHRVERSRFSPLYARIDDLKGGLTEREALIARLESERDAFDHAALHKGLLAVAATAGGMMILAVLLILVLS